MNQEEEQKLKKKQENDKFFLQKLLNSQKESKKKKIDYDSIEKKIKDYDKKNNPSPEKQGKDKSKDITELAFLGALIKSCKIKSKDKPEIEEDFTEELKQKKQIDLEINDEKETSLLSRLKNIFLGENASEELNQKFEQKSCMSLDELEDELELINSEDIEIGEDIFEKNEEDIEIGEDIFQSKKEDLDIEIGEDIFEKNEEDIEKNIEAEEEQEIDNKRNINR